MTATSDTSIAETTNRHVLRFAPSPNGELHLGHALSALSGFEIARALGGRFLLRIEDVDIGRSREPFVEAIYRDLAWLGIEWERPVLRQSLRFDDYRDAAGKLAEMGLLYPCFATRAEILASAKAGATDPDGAPLYSGLHRHLKREEVERRMGAGEPFAMRLRMDRAIDLARTKTGEKEITFTEFGPTGIAARVTARPERWGDVVILRKDVPASYHLAVTVDDARQGVTLVTRGLDLKASTDVHGLLQVLLELPQPMYLHHALVTDEDGRKLAKSARDTSLRELREAGVTPGDIRRRVDLATVLGRLLPNLIEAL